MSNAPSCAVRIVWPGDHFRLQVFVDGVKLPNVSMCNVELLPGEFPVVRLVLIPEQLDIDLLGVELPSEKIAAELSDPAVEEERGTAPPA